MAEWIIPCNPNYYKIDEAFSELKCLDWKQTPKNIEVGDIVYIYVSRPVQAIRYKCKVNKINLDQIEIDDSRFIINGETYQNYPVHMELKLLHIYSDELTIDKMKENGVKGNIQGARKVYPELQKYIHQLQN